MKACWIFAVLIGCCLVGCGGGGGGSSNPAGSQTAVPHVTVVWPERSRVVGGLSSALSIAVNLKGAAPDGGDINVTADRDPNPATHTTTYTAPEPALVGSYEVHAVFHAAAGGSGDVVGRIDATVAMDGAGNLPELTTVGVIKTVDVVAGQTLLVDEQKDLTFTTKDESGSLVAVTPGSALFAVTNGADRLQFASGSAKGVLPGQASVTAQVDGVTSAPVDVKVTSNATVSISPSPAAVSINGTLNLTATVSSTANQAVTWNVTEAGGGSVAANGVYTAPATEGTYHVTAVSQYDPEKQSTVAITVQSGGVNVGGDFPGSGGVNVGGDFPGSGGVTVGVN